MAEKTTQITITDLRSKKWLRGLLSFGLLIFAPITVGVIVGSSAMQWAGFILGFISICVWATNETKKTTFNSFAAARAYLDELEASAR